MFVFVKHFKNKGYVEKSLFESGESWFNPLLQPEAAQMWPP